MSCAKKGEVLIIQRKNRKGRVKERWKVVFIKHDVDGFPRDHALVAYAGTRHVARVPLKWLNRPKGA